jgi:hypothetical protein
MPMTKKINLKNFIFITLLLLALLITNANAMTSKEPKQVVIQESLLASSNKESNQKPLETDLSQGRDFSILSFNLDGSELMFNECFKVKTLNKDAKENAKVNEYECKIFRLNLKNKTLRHYNFPDQNKYRYNNGSFSPKGNFITFIRTPKTDPLLKPKEYYEQYRNNSQKEKIGIMNLDGSNFRIIKTEEGLKANPIMSNDETKIAYYRGVLRAPGSKTYATHFDIYEIDLKNKTDRLFAGPYQFFEVGQIQYLKGDKEILLHAYGPRRYAKEIFDYTRRYNNSSIYTIRRGKEELPEPMTIKGIIHLGNPFLAKNGVLFFYGQGEEIGPFTLGISLFRREKNGQVTQWVRNVKDNLGYAQNEQSIISTPDETKVFLIYTFYSGSEWVRPDLTKNGIAFFDVMTSKWSKLNILKANSSKPISVTGFSIIKTNKNTDLTNYLKELPTFTLTNPLKTK